MITLDQDESMLFTVRKHWFMFVLEAVKLISLFLLPIVIVLFLANSDRLLGVSLLGASDMLAGINGSIIVFFLGFWLLIIWTRFFVLWTDFYLDAWFVTSRRILDVEQRGFFKREISSLHFDRIQDVTIEIRGVINTLLNIGDIHVQSAGESREFVIRGVAHPYETKERLNRELEGVLKEYKSSGLPPLP